MPKVRTAAAVLAGMVLLGAVAPASAAPSRSSRRSEINDRIKSLREEVEEASEEEAELLDRFDAARARRREIDGRLAVVDTQLGIEQRGLDAAAARLEAVEAEVVVAKLARDRARAQVDAARTALRRRAVSAYVHSTPAATVNILLGVRSVRDIAGSRVLVRAVLDSQRKTVDRLHAVRADAVRLEAELEEKLAEEKTHYDEFMERTRLLEAAKAQQEALRQEALKEEANERSLLVEVQARKHQFEAQIAALQSESRSITALLRTRLSGPAQAARPGMLDPPIPYALVTSRFGPRVHPILGTARLHNGIDLRASAGTPIRAAADGVVVASDVRGGYGNTIVLDHGNSLATLYAHQRTLLVQAGQQVTMGQVIGLVGSTGFSTGPHLHFEVRVAGAPVDPLAYL